VQNAVERRKDESFIITFVMDSAEKNGRFVARIKYKKFVILMDKIGIVLKSLGGEYEKIKPHQFFSL
jgi:hypothetical protein